MRISFTVPFAIAFCLISLAWGLSQQRTFILKHELVIPAWEVKLRATISGEPLGLIVGHGHETRGKPRTSLWFLDKNTVAATFVTREGEPKLSKRGSLDVNAPLRLRALFFDANSGKVTNTNAWPTDSKMAGIVSTHDGKFVVQTGNVLTLYSPRLDALKTLRLPAVEGWGWVAVPSPTGRTLLLTPFGISASAIPWLWIKTDQLEINRSWQDIQSGNLTISDDKIAMAACVWVQNCEPTIEIGAPEADWKPIARVDRKTESYIHFVNEEMLFLLSDPAKLIRATGEVEFVQDMHSFGGCWPPQVVPAANGRRFVVPSCKLKGAVRELDIGGHNVLKNLLIYDAPFRGPSYVLDLKGPELKNLTTLAVSPDGSRIAILNIQTLTLELIELPPLQHDSGPPLPMNQGRLNKTPDLTRTSP